jgi:4-hydroxyphenylpyruvate dioxygenase-like putative hemolysin
MSTHLPRSHTIGGVSSYEKEASILGDMLRTLGFAPAAKHRNKSVTLWRQGGINIVINTEQEGFAHSTYVMHGTSNCSPPIGLALAVGCLRG